MAYRDESAEDIILPEDADPKEESEDLQRKLAEMEEELTKLKQVQQAQVQLIPGGSLTGHGPDDSKSIFIGNVHPDATAEDLQSHFQGCGTVNLVTILADKLNRPRGFAYLEFAEKEGMLNALELNESLLHGRQLKVMPKRLNVPGFGRGRGGRPRIFRPAAARFAFYRPRGRVRYHPYG